jgi:hypothetical protein
MNATIKQNRQLVSVLMRDLASPQTGGAPDPRTEIVATELRTLDATEPERFVQALAEYRRQPCAHERERLETDLVTALNHDPALAARLWFLVTAGEDCRAQLIDNKEATGTPGRAQSWFGPFVYVTSTMVALLAYVVFVRNESWRLPFAKGAAFLLFSSLPGWLYLRFVHVKAAQVLSDYVLALHRLGVDKPEFLPEPPRASIFYDRWYDQGGPCYRSHSTIYMAKFEAQYGRASRTGASRPSAKRSCLGALLPVAVVGLICSVGWASILLDESFLTGLSVASPANVIRFGFLGAYSFVIQMLVRRYLQQDLRPSTYVSATVRFILVFILAFVIASVSPSAPVAVQFAVAFIVGFFPIVGMQWLRNFVTVALRRVVPTLQSAYPLADLDGLNVWYEAQLLEVGVEDMQNLVTANVVDILLTTRVPIGRLVDWIDQAALVIRLPSSSEETPKDRDDRSDINHAALRRVGIRSATDLEAVFPPTFTGMDMACLQNDELLRCVSEVLDMPLPPITVLALLRSFGREPNLALVRSWRADWRTLFPAATDDPTAPGQPGELTSRAA